MTIPARLEALGFTAHQINGVENIIPPLCDMPAGGFLMGSDPQQDKAARRDEQPQSLVPLPYPFQIARHPVSVAEYACFVRAGHTAPPPGTFRPIAWNRQLDHPDHPAVCVCWHDATAYAAWLASVTGQPWRLPTEAEWEKAARWDAAANTSLIYPWGNAFDPARCNTSESGIRATTPIGSSPTGASPCGAHDMAGNVWEWTSSVHKPYPYQASDGRERPEATGHRVLRGGSWHFGATVARATYRGHTFRTALSTYFGFRLVLATGAVPGS